ncbi:MAG: CRISPR system precrRNA processing endoribonuclease RAMP protein Cas6 [Lachnospiraceae bacterium]|nr:CRISPR system precrRNA processing endoribonuclease RAMP protein Cas6 [Lachnospiraceae bacterium]
MMETQCDIKPSRFWTSGEPIEGFVGTVRYSGDVTRYLPYIDLGSQIHIGKKTTRGCGGRWCQVCDGPGTVIVPVGR